MKPFIGIKNIWYGPPLTADLKNVAAIKALVEGATFTKVTNSHDGTWGYSQDDPDVTEYKNELTGKTYYRDKVSDGAKTITFTMGVYDFKQLADLQGGTVIEDTSNPVGWKADDESLENVEKAFVAQTKTGNYIVFSNASVVAKTDQQEKNLGLGITAVCLESNTKGVASEYRFAAVEG